MAASDGVIKYQCHWNKTAALDPVECRSLIEARDRLKAIGYIGVDQQGIGYGNISRRLASSSWRFLITGSQTGHLDKLSNQHIALVTDCNLARNELHCEGPIKASSEALSHGAIYLRADWVNCVVHIHDQALWHKLIHHVPTTSSLAAYGTAELALEIDRLVGQSPDHHTQIIVLQGHEPGLIIYGDRVDHAVDRTVMYKD